MAASSGAVRAGKAQVELFLEDSAFVRGLNASEKKLKEWGSAMTGFGTQLATAGAAGVAAFGGAVAAFVSAGSRLDDMSQRTGVSVEALSELEYAATMSGTSLETLEGGLIKLQNKMVDALAGNEAAAKSFTDLGLSVDQLSQMSAEDQFAAIADAIGSIEDPAQKTAMAMEVFGKSGQQLVPFLNSGSKGLAELRQQARDLGITMDGEAAGAAAELGDVFDQLKAQVMQVVIEVGYALAPALISMGKALQPIIRGVIDFVKNNQWLVQTVAALAAGLLAAGGTLIAIGSAVSLVGVAIGGLVAAGGAVVALFAALISPVGLVVVGLAAAATAFFTLTASGQKAVSTISSGLKNLLSFVRETFGGISSALQSGDLASAGEIAINALSIAWSVGIDAIKTTWESAWSAIMQTVEGAMLMVAQGVVSGFSIIDSFLPGFSDSIINAFLTAFEVVQGAWFKIQDVMAEGILYIMSLLGQVNFDEAIGDLRSQQDQNRDLRGKQNQQRREDIGGEGALEKLTNAIEQSIADRAAERDQQQADAQAARQAEIEALMKRRDELLNSEKNRQQAESEKIASKKPNLDGGGGIGGTASGGTFSALAAQALVGGGPFSQIEKNTKDTAKGVKELAKKKPVAVAGD